MHAMSDAPHAQDMAKRDLSSLRIHREAAPTTGSSAALAWSIVAVLLLALAGGAAYVYVAKPPALVAAAAPQPAPATPAPAPPADPQQSGGLSASGYIVARRKADVGTKLTARVTDVYVEAGDNVPAGALLARLEQRDLMARANEAKAVLDRARLKLARSRRLLQENLATPDEVEADEADEKVATARLALAEADLADTEVRAPFAGAVIRRAIDPGASFSPINVGASPTSGAGGMFTLVDLDSLEAEVDVSERQLRRLKVGDPAIVEVDALPGKRLRASLSRVIQTADRARGVVKVKLALEEKDPLLLPDMTARATFIERQR